MKTTVLPDLTYNCDANLELDSIKFVTVMNVLYTEAGYHNVGIFMLSKVEKETFDFIQMIAKYGRSDIKSKQLFDDSTKPLTAHIMSR